MNVDTGTATTRSPAQLALTVGALGVVFGDIGTSPIYTVQTVFNPTDPHPVPVTTDSVYGVISLIFWSVTIIVTIKYMLLVMRADNDGEGGILGAHHPDPTQGRVRGTADQGRVGGTRDLRGLPVLRRQHDHNRPNRPLREDH
jgi:K+ potassium transporter